MKIVVMGGAVMLVAVPSRLASEPGISRVTVADWNIPCPSAGQEAASFGVKCWGVAVRVDANRHQSLVDCITGHQVVASALGPFHQYELKLVPLRLKRRHITPDLR